MAAAERIGLLAVMDNAATLLLLIPNEPTGAEGIRLKQAHAAAAELIEAGEPISNAIENNIYDDSSDNESVEIVLSVGELRRFRAALARVQGEGA